MRINKSKNPKISSVPQIVAVIIFAPIGANEIIGAKVLYIIRNKKPPTILQRMFAALFILRKKSTHSIIPRKNIR